MRIQILGRGLASLCLSALLIGCAASPVPTPAEPRPQALPWFLTDPRPAPVREIHTNRDLLQLLADYEALRIRFNADRRAVALIFRNRQAQE